MPWSLRYHSGSGFIQRHRENQVDLQTGTSHFPTLNRSSGQFYFLGDSIMIMFLPSRLGAC